jgi:hypothetical protein
MMYGMALPILFPIAGVSFLVLYVLEKLMIYYFYSEPPTSDEKLH